MSIFIIGQKVWAPDAAGPPKKPDNNIYKLVNSVEDEEGTAEGYDLEHEGKLFFAYKGTIRHLEDVEVCKECGSDKLQQAVWQDNTGKVLEYMEGLDPFCPECNETMTRSFHCNLKEYLEYQEEQRIYEENAMRANKD